MILDAIILIFGAYKYTNFLKESSQLKNHFCELKTPEDIIILSIESSCDDTSAAIIKNGRVLSNITANQDVHEQYGGVVPELASRQHQIHIVPVIDRALKQAGIDKSQLSAVAFTRGPGLLGSLLVGVSFAKAFALALNLPLIEVHHMQAHVLALFSEEDQPNFPFLCLTVSGGHTQIVHVKSHLDMEVIGSTIDDAAGEAFDKCGKMMGLPYPSGPQIDKLAKTGIAKYSFTEPQIDGYDFSFSGFKTSVLYFLKKEVEKNPDFIREERANLCASIQSRIVSILINKLEKAAKDLNIKTLGIAGGVSANSELRQAVKTICDQEGWNYYIPKISYCTDNAAMIGITAHYKFLNSDFSEQEVKPDPRLSWT